MASLQKIIRVSFKKDDIDHKWNYHFDPNNTTTTVGDVKSTFAMMNGFYEDRIRLTYDSVILDDTTPISKMEDGWENCSDPSSSDSDEDKGSSGAEAEENQDDQPEKELEGSETEKSQCLMKLFNNFYGKMSSQPNYEKGKLDKPNKQELKNQIITVMRMQPEERKEFEMTVRPEPALVLDLEVEEAFTIAIITANEDVKYLACRGEDTLGVTKHRCANLFQCSRPEDLELRKREDSNIFLEGELQQSLTELGIEDGGSLFASRKGRHKIRTLFGLCACMDIDVNMEKTARSLRRKIVAVAPDLTYVNFFMWYSGKFLSIEKNGRALGEVIMGSSLLRVVIEMDSSIPHDVDTGPDLRRRSDEEEARLRRKNISPRLSSSSEKSGNSQEKTVKPCERLWFDVNKRALRNFDLVVECHRMTVTYKDKDGKEHEFDNKGEDEAAISLTKLTHRMLFYELRKKIAAACGENKTHQILYRNGERFKSEDDRKTLRELELVPEGGIVKTIYKEPSIVVWVKYKDEKISMKVAGNGTSFGCLARLMVDEKKVPLTYDKIAFEHEGLVISKDVLFSECQVVNGDTIKLVETFKVRVWQGMYIYDKEFWPHSLIFEFKNWIEKESKIPVNKQVFVTINDDNIIDLNDHSKVTLKDYGMESMGEIEVFEKGDPEIPEHLQQKLKGNADDDAAGATGFIESKEDSSSSNDEDDPGYVQD